MRITTLILTCIWIIYLLIHIHIQVGLPFIQLLRLDTHSERSFSTETGQSAPITMCVINIIKIQDNAFIIPNG
jgi:hypothetical protein